MAELGARACVRAPRVVLAVVVCGTVLALLAPIAIGAGAPSDRVARVAASCSNETVDPGFGKPITLRFVLHGVSCNTGHRLIQTYFHDIATKTCRGHGTTCIFEYPGGWDCSSPPPSFPISASHRFAVCQTFGGRPTASVTVYRAARKSGASTPGHPPCTRRALVAGLKRGAEPRPTATFSHGAFGCAGRFAYASGVIFKGNEEVDLFIASGGRWETADRGKYCLNHQVPLRIYKPACTTS